MSKVVYVPGEYCRIHLRVKCETEIGQTVGVSGNISSLGNYDKTHVLNLVTTPDAYPIWYTLEPIVLPLGHVLSYKYCISDGGEFSGFENRDTGRVITPNQTDILVDDEFATTSLEGYGFDSEAELLSEVKHLTQITEESKVDFTQINNDSRLLIVCYHLPVILVRTGNINEPFTATWSESLIAKSSNSSISGTFNTFWMGTISVAGGDNLTKRETLFLMNLLTEMNCIPIFVDSLLATNMYQGFCKMVMWPIFHNVDQLDQIFSAWNLANANSNPDSILDWNTEIETYRIAYEKVNDLFAVALGNWLHSGDILWVHDYHLMFLPKLVRDLNRNVQIVFFLHIPFPTSQIFRSLPAATQLLQSLSAADVVGFHTFDHARHFLTACKRILGLRSHTKQGGILALQVQDREVIISVSHVSVETKDIDKILINTDTWERVKKLKEKFSGRKIIAGLDVCQRLSGGIFKLAAYEKLLTDYPNVTNQVVLYQKMMRSGSRPGDEETTSNDMREMVKRINDKFGTIEQPAVYYEEVELRSVSLVDRIVLWLTSDVFLLTPIKEGLNLFPLEFIYARDELYKRNELQSNDHSINAQIDHTNHNHKNHINGVVIVSEFSCCASLLNGSLKVNPYYTLIVADTIHKALYMTSDESKQRRERDIGFITSHPSSLWTHEVISDLRYISNSNFKNSINSNKNIKKISEPIPLLLDSVLESYSNAVNTNRSHKIIDACSRLFIFDYGGTLLNKEKSDIYIKQTLSAISGRRPTG